MTDDDSESELPIATLVVVGALILAALTLPTFAPGTAPGEQNASNGTIVTPDGTTLEEVDGVDRGPLDGLNALPASHLRDDESPTVHASTGAQTMRVETTTVDGEPALNLSDDRTHDGRWVAVPTEWFNRTQGGVPSVARIAHEENGTYTEAIQVRGDSAAFYVRGFSTNTVTFGGELVIRDRPAVDGTRHSYQLDSRDSVDNLVINATGVENTAEQSQSERLTDGGSTTLDVGGTAEPTDGRVTFSVDWTEVKQTPGNSGSGETRLIPYSSGQGDGFAKYPYNASGADTLRVKMSRGDGVPTDIYVIDGWSDSYSNGDATTGQLVKSGWQASDGWNEIPLDSSIDSTSDTVTIAFDSQESGLTQQRIDTTDGSPTDSDYGYIGDSTSSNYASIELVSAGQLDSATVSTDTDSATVSNVGSGETKTVNLDISDGDTLTVDHSESVDIPITATWNATTETRDPVVELNGRNASYNGTLADGETVDLGGSVSWLEDGQNNITVHVGDGSYSGDGPEPQVDLEFRHGLESPRSVEYESEALSERYNISKTYTTARANASLTIPHARTVLSMRALDYRLNETGSWSSVPEAAANLSGTTLTVDVSTLAGDPVPEGTTIEVRSTGSRVDAHESSISVLRATPVGFDMDSRIRLDSWGIGSYLEVGETPQGGLVYYAENESYSAESDYVELFANGDQRLYAPNASSGSELTLQTLSARVSPERNSMRVRVPESANATDTEFVVEPASVVGDSWTAEYVAGTDGQWYAVVDSAGEELGAAEKPSPITVDRDDVGLVSIVPTEPPSASTDGAGGGIFATVTTGNLPSLLALFGSVGMLFVAGTRPAASRDAIDGFASGVDGAVSRVPRVGPAVGGALESAVSGAGSALVSVGENRLLTGAVGAAVALAAAQAGLFSVGSEAGAIISVAGIAVGSLYLLREAGEFTTARWIAIVGVAGVVALQGLGEGDLLAQFVNSDAFLIAVLIGGYAVIQLVREYRANNSPDDDRPQVVIGGQFRSGDDEGSD